MSGSARTMQELQARCRDRTAAVLTETEIWERLRSGRDAFDLDVAVFAFGASMRGCAGMILVPVAGRGVFTRAESITLNAVPAHPGPAPNERLGVVDAQIFSDQTADWLQDGPVAPGAQVLLDVLDNRKIQVECQSIDGGVFHNAFRMDEVEFARMVTYNTFLPARLHLTRDGRPPAHLAMLRTGSTIFLNGASGVVIGDGTRSAPGKASLSLSADMLQMAPQSIERRADDVTMSVVVPIPVLDDAVRQSVCACLADLSPVELDRTVRPLDREMARRVKDVLEQGQCLLTSSTLPIPGFVTGEARFP